jgi:hypothetical protein
MNEHGSLQKELSIPKHKYLYRSGDNANFEEKKGTTIQLSKTQDKDFWSSTEL